MRASIRAIVNRLKSVAQIKQTYQGTSSTYEYTVPAGYTSLTVKLWGGGGYTPGSNYAGGGGAIKGSITVAAGDVIYIRVGQAGYSNPYNGSGGTALKVSRGGGAIGTMMAGGGGNAPASPEAWDGGYGAGGTAGAGAGFGGGAGATPTEAGAGGDSGSAYAVGSAGTGPYDFDTMATTVNGGAGGDSNPYFGAPGGGGYYGGGGGEAYAVDSADYNSGGGGGAGQNSGFSSVTTYAGQSLGVAGNSSDTDRPSNAGNQGNAGAAVIILT